MECTFDVPGQEEVPELVHFLFLQLSQMVSTDYVMFCQHDNIQYFIQNRHTKAENRLVNLEENLKSAKARVANKMVMGLKSKKIDRSSKILGKVVYHRKEFLNFNVAMCMCGDVFSQYKDLDCKKVDTKNKKNALYCIRGWTTITQLHCALWMRRKGVVEYLCTWIYFPRKQVACASSLRSEEDAAKDVPDFTIGGLEEYPSIHNWVLESVRVNSKVSTDGSYLEWVDRIPKQFGKVLLDKCKSLSWTITNARQNRVSLEDSTGKI